LVGNREKVIPGEGVGGRWAVKKAGRKRLNRTPCL